MEKKRSGWRTLGLIAGIGCLSMIALVVTGVVIAIVSARATISKLGDTETKPAERRITLPPAPLSDRAPGTDAGKTAPLQLTIDLQEGDFTIRPGAPGTDIHVEGEYAPGLYELIETHDTDAATGARRMNVRFRSKAPAWARFFASIGSDDTRQSSKLTLTIPRGAPIDLQLNMAMGRSEVDLGGLTLGAVDVNASMGEHRIAFQEPVVEGVRQLRLNTSMGNVTLDNLGNARADSINASGSMGNVVANLGGAWAPGSNVNVTFEQSMGELTLRVPSSVRLEADVRDSRGEKSTRTPDAKPPDDPNAPTLRVRVNSSMGETRIVRY